MYIFWSYISSERSGLRNLSLVYRYHSTFSLISFIVVFFHFRVFNSFHKTWCHLPEFVLNFSLSMSSIRFELSEAKLFHSSLKTQLCWAWTWLAHFLVHHTDDSPSLHSQWERHHSSCLHSSLWVPHPSPFFLPSDVYVLCVLPLKRVAQSAPSFVSKQPLLWLPNWPPYLCWSLIRWFSPVKCASESPGEFIKTQVTGHHPGVSDSFI